MGSAQALFVHINVRSPLPPPPSPLGLHQKIVPSWDFTSTFTRITATRAFNRKCFLLFQESNPTNFSASPPGSQFNNLCQEQEELGFKEKNHKIHRPYKTAPIITQCKREEQDGKACYESQSLRDDASSLHFVSHFSTRTSGRKSGKEGERKPPVEDEEGLDGERPRPGEEDTGVPVVCKGMAKGTRRRQIMKRSTMIAKQVISIQSALSLGFVSQLWVDTKAWAVLFVEVKPNLLSSELERFSFEDLAKVGDVVLVEDESVMENDFKLVGLETLVGYTVETPGRRNIGKVRGYNFNINSGVVESLEIDSFGISIIPSSLVSTYALFVEDVLEVLPDTVIVHEAAASRIQRLTKGFLGGAQKSIDDEFEECGDHRGSRKRNLSSGKFPGEVMGHADDWKLPMDYL